MPDLPEASVWHDTIHQVEDGDPVMGGVPNRETKVGGPNIAAKGLADRTQWLKTKVEEALAKLTGAQILQLLLPVDGPTSNLDADTLDGKHASAFVLKSSEGSGNGLNADTVDGLHAAQLMLGAVPVGGWIGWSTDTLPAANWAFPDGGEYLRADYPEIVASGSHFVQPGFSAEYFTLKDVRGWFHRVWDGGRGVDPGRVLGSYQADELRAHYHALVNIAGSDDVPDTGVTVGAKQSTNTNNDHLSRTTSVGGTETRPKNWADPIIIRMF